MQIVFLNLFLHCSIHKYLYRKYKEKIILFQINLYRYLDTCMRNYVRYKCMSVYISYTNIIDNAIS